MSNWLLFTKQPYKNLTLGRDAAHLLLIQFVGEMPRLGESAYGERAVHRQFKHGSTDSCCKTQAYRCRLICSFIRTPVKHPSCGWCCWSTHTEAFSQLGFLPPALHGVSINQTLPWGFPELVGSWKKRAARNLPRLSSSNHRTLRAVAEAPA